MVFSWDPHKSDDNLARRGFDFATAARIFESRALMRPDLRQDYGELRMVAVGAVNGIELTVVFTDRIEGDQVVRRIISARRSNRRERETFAQAKGDAGL